MWRSNPEDRIKVEFHFQFDSLVDIITNTLGTLIILIMIALVCANFGSLRPNQARQSSKEIIRRVYIPWYHAAYLSEYFVFIFYKNTVAYVNYADVIRDARQQIWQKAGKNLTNIELRYPKYQVLFRPISKGDGLNHFMFFSPNPKLVAPLQPDSADIQQADLIEMITKRKGSAYCIVYPSGHDLAASTQEQFIRAGIEISWYFLRSEDQFTGLGQSYHTENVREVYVE
jgi:hypothetical protein